MKILPVAFVGQKALKRLDIECSIGYPVTACDSSA